MRRVAATESPVACPEDAESTMAAAAQGGWETDEDMHAAAKRETVEEAGVRGKLEVWPADHELSQVASVQLDAELG